jgi:hypothetical protein
MDDFFADDMAPFLEAQETPNQKRTRGGKAVAMRLNIPVVLSLVGESITNFVSVAATENDATVALDEIAPGDISSAVLPSWTGRLSRLKTMTLWDGVVLNEDLANAINHHCPNFKDLTFYRCSRDGTDPDFAAFFGALRSNSLESFTALNAQGIGQKTLLALNNHSSSLKVLHLDGLWYAPDIEQRFEQLLISQRCDAIKNLSLLQGCLALESLFIKDAHGNIDLEATENDVFLEVVDWLGRCERLRELTFEKLVSAPTILTHLCLNNDTRLRKLKVTGYSLTGSQDFHKALSHQTTLQSLTLTAEAEGSFRDDIDTLVSSVCQLKALTHLDLCDASDYFRNPEISRIATSLKRLETFTFSGYDVTDAVWYAISGLHSLRVLAIQALTSFTVDGVLGYISTLQPTNQGLVLSLWKQNGESDFSENDKSIIQESIADKVEGRFEFELFRGDSDYSVDSDW